MLYLLILGNKWFFFVTCDLRFRAIIEGIIFVTWQWVIRSLVPKLNLKA